MSSVLIIGPAWVGDMVMAQTLFKALKIARPELAIDVLAPDWSRPLLDRMQEVRQALSLPFKHGDLKIMERYRLAQHLPVSYEQAIVLPNSFKSALIPYFAGIPIRTGWRGELRYGVLNDVRRLDKSRYPRMVDRFTALAHAKGADPAPVLSPSLTVNLQAQAAAVAKFGLEPEKHKVLSLCPGAEFGPSKQWPLEHCVALGQAKLEQGWQIWLFGSPNDKTLCDAIAAALGPQCHNLAGRTHLSEAIDLLGLSQAVVSNDSGLMHIAAALERPLVALFGSTDPSFTPPLNAKHAIARLGLPCSPCFERTCPLSHHQCMRDLKPTAVDALLSTLEP